jgi:hypothetical protein
MFRSEKAIQASIVMSVRDLGLDTQTGIDKVILTFLDRAEAIATRWVQMPTGVLLFVMVPGDPHSGAIYLFDRRKAIFYLLDFSGEPTGQQTTDDYERLLREQRLLNFVRRPWLLRTLVSPPKAAPNGAFACAA